MTRAQMIVVTKQEWHLGQIDVLKEGSEGSWFCVSNVQLACVLVQTCANKCPCVNLAETSFQIIKCDLIIIWAGYKIT